MTDLPQQDEKSKCLYLHDLTWPEVKEALPQVKVAIIPVGSTEQHGPHATFEMDTAGSREFAKRLGERLYPHALVTPPVSIGVSSHHMHFPGTLTLQPETLASVLMDIVRSLHAHGIRRFFFANGHGGNRPVLGIVTARIRQEWGDSAAWGTVPNDNAQDVVQKHVKSETHGHSCEIEISNMLYLWPDAVRQSALTAGKITPLGALRRAKGYVLQESAFFDENTENGCLGDARLATKEIGKEIVETALDRLSALLTDFMDRDM